MTRIGTSHFVSFQTAVRYYRPYGYENTVETVKRKILEGEIHIGKPPLAPGEKLVILDNGTRYGIEEIGNVRCLKCGQRKQSDGSIDHGPFCVDRK